MSYVVFKCFLVYVNILMFSLLYKLPDKHHMPLNKFVYASYKFSLIGSDTI